MNRSVLVLVVMLAVVIAGLWASMSDAERSRAICTARHSIERIELVTNPPAECFREELAR